MNLYKICEQKLKYLNYSKRTSEIYLHYIDEFLSSIGKPPTRITSSDFQSYLDNYNFTSVSQQNQIINAIRFLYKFGLDKKYDKHKVRGVTINTDASYYVDYKAGGFAFWIKTDNFKLTKGGKFKGDILTSQEAETKCIGNAIAMLLSQKDLPKAGFLCINTDSKHSIEQITKRKDKLGIQVNDLWNRLIHRLGSKKNYFKHVKSHTGKNDARSYINDWCDEEAKKWAKEAVKDKKEKLKQ